MTGTDIDRVLSGDVAPSMDKIMQLETAIQEQLDPVDLESQTFHHFAPGIYTRELRIPAGTVLTGKIHRHITQNILVSGTIRVTTDEGMKTLTGPLIFNSQAGTKKAAVTVTDTIWLNVHPTELTDLEEIEDHFIVPSIAALEQENKICLGRWQQAQQLALAWVSWAVRKRRRPQRSSAQQKRKCAQISRE